MEVFSFISRYNLLMKETFASSLRPTNLSEVVGQSHIMPFLKRIVEKREKVSILFYGKPGIGKTSLAYALCNDLKVTYAYFNAATGNKAELQEKINFSDFLIVDEIHRLNKDKQDVLLPAIEFGKVKIIATTTENPYFVVNPAVRSRVHILELKELSPAEISEGLKNIITRHKLKIEISDEMLLEIAKQSNGDYRYCLNILNLLEKLYSQEEVTKDVLKTLMPSMHFYSDKDGDGHYDLLSAFHKSLRGSDVDASIYYLARLIESGDIIGLERRMLAVAYEDVGLASPNVALRVVSAVESAKRVGFPEARIPLVNAVIDLASAPKSNSAYMAIEAALEMVRNGGVYDIPDHMKDAHYASASKLGKGVGYKYPHDYGGYVEQQYLPDKIKNKKFYRKNEKDKL